MEKRTNNDLQNTTQKTNILTGIYLIHFDNEQQFVSIDM